MFDVLTNVYFLDRITIFRETTNDFLSSDSVITFQKVPTLNNISSDVALTKRRQSSICSGKISVL